MNELIIGSHVSFKSKDQLVGSVKEALGYLSNTFMFYTGAPQNTSRSNINDDLTKEAWQLMKENNIDINNVIVHAPYIVNLANRANMDFNIRFLKEEVNRCRRLGIKKIVIHPGSHVGQGIEVGIKNIIDTLNFVLTDEDDVTILLETMAGKGSEIGSNIDELKAIIDGVNTDNIGICIDTCHINDSGYSVESFDEFLNNVDEVIGLSKVGCIHINDSKNELSAHKDRHENIGYGTIGFDNLIKVIYHEKLKNVPKILETPYINKEHPPYKEEIEMIRNKKFNDKLYEIYK